MPWGYVHVIYQAKIRDSLTLRDRSYLASGAPQQLYIIIIPSFFHSSSITAFWNP